MNTRPIGIYNYANSYRLAAQALQSARTTSTHPDAPIQFLKNHAFELYLKAFLHACGFTEIELSNYKKFGHGLNKLAWESKKRGLCPSEQTYNIFNTLDQLNTQITSRYIKPRLYRPISDTALDRALEELHRLVGKELRKKGFQVRI